MKVKTMFNTKTWTVQDITTNQHGTWVRIVNPMGRNGTGSLTGYTIVKAEEVTEWIK